MRVSGHVPFDVTALIPGVAIRALAAALAISLSQAALGCSKRPAQTNRSAHERAPQAPPGVDNAAVDSELESREPEPVRFRVPGPLDRQRAIGGAMSLALDRVLYEHEGFVAKGAPESGDWLDRHDEPGQGFDRYVSMRPNRPDAERSTIYLLPIGDLRASGANPVRNPSMKVMADYVRIFFATPVAILPAVSVAEVGAAQRGGRGFGDKQLLTTDILAYLTRNLPDDAYALVALTAVDLYPEPSWNFVFGQASLRNRVGVYSLARYQPNISAKADDGADDTSSGEKRRLSRVDARRIVLRRALQVMSHELGHMFGIMHCIYFECVMNGSNSLPETDSQPMHLCPVDLRKVLHASKAQPVARYRELAAFYRRHGLDKERAFVELRLRVIEGQPDGEAEGEVDGDGDRDGDREADRDADGEPGADTLGADR